MGQNMNKYFLMSIICFILGIVMLGLGVSRGEGEVYWAVIFPIFHGTGIIFFLGTILIILGIILVMVGFVAGSSGIEFGSFDDLMGDDEDYHEQYPNRHRQRPGKRPYDKGFDRPERRTNAPYRPRRTSIKSGVVVFIGPIPIMWGSDKKIGYIMAVVAVILVVIFLIFTLAWVF